MTASTAPDLTPIDALAFELPAAERVEIAQKAARMAAIGSTFTLWLAVRGDA